MYLLRNFSHVRSHFDKSSFETLMHAFISSRLDYCNSLFANLPASTLRPLQLVQNYAARLILRRSKFSHITPVLYELHWLPINSRIKFKILLFVYKSLNDLAPKYLSSLLTYYQSPRSLRSSNNKLLKIPSTNKKSMGDRAFSVFGPKIWNNLPLEIRSAPSVNSFKKLIKTYLFKEHFDNLIF